VSAAARGTRATAERPLVVHLTSTTFTPRSHPAIFRTVTGVAAHFTSLVLCGEHAAYHGGALAPEEERALQARRVFRRELEFVRLKKPGQLEWLAAGVRRRFGRPLAVVAYVGNNGWRALPLCRTLDVPVLAWFIGNDASVDLRDEKYAWRYERLREAPGARYRGVSSNIVARLLEFGMAPERTGVLHMGVDLDLYRAPDRSGRAGKPPKIVLGARLMDFKGHRFALGAFAGLAREHPGATLHLFGEGPLEGELRARAAALGVASAVHFRGMVPIEELRRELESADFALQPSVTAPDGRAEGLPNVVLEELATGLPVIASRHAGIPDAVVHEETGLLVEEGDAPGLEQAMLRLASDFALRLRLGASARRRAEERFDARRLGAALAADVRSMAEAYRSIPAAERERAWAAATRDLIEPPAEYGPRYRAAWWWKALKNRVAGEVG
jgi:glycosyltransferase involved in cell wall biosynthesis